jgi:hypothetical protein
MTCNENCCLVDHAVIHVIVVSVEVALASADRVVLDTHVDGLGRIQRTDCDRRLLDHAHELVRGFSEEGDRGDVIGDVGGHRVRYARCGGSIRYHIRGNEAYDGRALGVSAEHHLGFGTIRRHGLDMSARVTNAVDGTGEIGGGRVVNRVHANRLSGRARAHVIDESLSDPANARWLCGTACEHHLIVGTRLGRHDRHGGADQRPSCHNRSDNVTSDGA